MDTSEKSTLNLAMVCEQTEYTAHLPIAWFQLHRAGFTREWLKIASDHPDWKGPKPRFETAPGYDSPFWNLMEKESDKAWEARK